MFRVAVFVLFAGLIAYAQTSSKPEVVPIDKEPSHKLVFENEYVRVFSVEVAPRSETKYHRHERDSVGVILGDAEVETVRVGEAAVKLHLKDGETSFTKGGFAHKAVNKGDKPFRNMTVELKKGVGEIAPLIKTPSHTEQNIDFAFHRITYQTKIEAAKLRALDVTYEGRTRLALARLPKLKMATSYLLIPVNGAVVCNNKKASKPCPLKGFKAGEVGWDQDGDQYILVGRPTPTRIIILMVASPL